MSFAKIPSLAEPQACMPECGISTSPSAALPAGAMVAATAAGAHHAAHHSDPLREAEKEADLIGREVEKVEQEAEKEFKSVGKRVHNELTYRGVDFLLNSTIGVAFTYWTARTKSGEKYWGKPVTGFFQKVLSPVLKSPSALAEGARWGSMFTSIIVGGTAIILPMVALENKHNKKAIINTVNEKIHGEEKVQNDPRFAAELERVDTEPKKNFTIGMAARLIVLAPMLWATFTPAINKNMIKYLYKPIADTSKWTAKQFGIQPKRLMERGVMELADGDLKKAPQFVSDWDFIHRTIGFDFGLTFIYSFAHEATIKTLAAMGFKLTEDKKAPEAAADAAAAAQTQVLPEPQAQDHASRLPAKPAAHTQRVAKRESYREEIIHQPEATLTEMIL